MCGSAFFAPDKLFSEEGIYNGNFHPQSPSDTFSIIVTHFAPMFSSGLRKRVEVRFSHSTDFSQKREFTTAFAVRKVGSRGMFGRAESLCRCQQRDLSCQLVSIGGMEKSTSIGVILKVVEVSGSRRRWQNV
jgi:hypothetical protein